MKDEEKDMFEKYLKKGYSLWGRIKFKMFRTKKKIKTIKDLEFLDYNMMMKLICLIFLASLINYVGAMIWKVWLWLFPEKVFVLGAYI